VGAPTCQRKQEVGKTSWNAAQPCAMAHGCVNDDLRADGLQKSWNFRLVHGMQKCQPGTMTKWKTRPPKTGGKGRKSGPWREEKGIVDRAYRTESVFVVRLSHKVKRLTILRFILLYPFFILILTTW